MPYFCIGFSYICRVKLLIIMAKNLLNKYVWLVDTIYKAQRISFDEINHRWLDNDMSEGKPLALRTYPKILHINVIRRILL